MLIGRLSPDNFGETGPLLIILYLVKYHMMVSRLILPNQHF